MATNNSINLPTGASGKLVQAQGVGVANGLTTATYPSTATGTGKILRADGTNWSASTATYPDVATGTNKVLKADGTNWVASTETYAAPGTLGNVMTSDGTNWTSAAPSSSGLTAVTINLTNAQIKALAGTPITAVAAPGAGKMVRVFNAIGKLTYGGSNVFTAGSGQAVGLYYGSGGQAAYANIISGTSLVSSTTNYNQPAYPAIANIAATSYENLALVIQNPSGVEIGGNAANNNLISIWIAYDIITL